MFPEVWLPEVCQKKCGARFAQGNQVGRIYRLSATVGESDKRIDEDEHPSWYHVPCKTSALEYVARRKLTSGDNYLAEEMAAQVTMSSKDHPTKASPPVLPSPKVGGKLYP